MRLTVKLLNRTPRDVIGEQLQLRLAGYADALAALFMIRHPATDLERGEPR